ncbi:MAG: hypothetical protein V4463_21820 [Pseudomonadota bacterium]
MKQSKPFPDPADAQSLTDEADIGSGEKTAADADTEALIRQIPPLPQDEGDGPDVDDARAQHEHDASLIRDEPCLELDALDPVPPKGP